MYTTPLTRDNANPASGRLRGLRKAAQLSQEELARRAGCSTASVKLFESGYTPERSDVLPRILRALNDHDPGDKSRAAVKLAGGAATRAPG
ncbi:MAG: helix-turn-helix domain-containing protein [Thermoleophilaceae bacterium]